MRRFKIYNITKGPNGEPKNILAGEAVESRDGRIDLYLGILGLQTHLAMLPEPELRAKPLPPAPVRPSSPRPPRGGSGVSPAPAHKIEVTVRGTFSPAAMKKALEPLELEHNHPPQFAGVDGCQRCNAERIVREEAAR